MPKQSHTLEVPFFRPSVTQDEIAEVVACLRSGWMTTGPRVRQFETDLAQAVKAKHAVAVNSCTAALHLAVEALGLKPDHAVLVPTMTFAATAEVVRYMGAFPLLVDCDPTTFNLDLNDAARKIEDLRAGRTPLDKSLKVVGIMPVHVGGLMMEMSEVQTFAGERGLWIVEDAAHALPAAYRTGDDAPWRQCGENTAAVTCFSFYANKTITTGEGGMAVTDEPALADRMRQMSLHGLSHDAWKRFAGGRVWDYQIVAPGFKYNLTDIAAALGIHQLRRAELMRSERECIADCYRRSLEDVGQLELPTIPANRLHAWHLFPIRLCLEKIDIDRNAFIDALRCRGVGCSVHWRPLHLHPYYQETFGWQPEHLPVASAEWTRTISLPLFPGMREDERQHVVQTVRELCAAHAKI
jgi:dTDP-4-amino-4,6-dideoxygalactose transaminase